MFERFDEGARQAVVLAQQWARDTDAVEISCIHLLAGVAQSKHGGQRYTTAAIVLRQMGLKDNILARVVKEGRFARHPVDIPADPGKQQARITQQLPFTVAIKKSMDLALKEALSMGHTQIRSEHLLLGLVRLGEEGVLDAFVRLPRYLVMERLVNA
jgi:ATP-dependent Clp protease ATP-binding subunit ClpC